MTTPTELWPQSFAFPADGAVRAVFVSSTDGAVTVSGRAGGLGNATDRALFAVHRSLADVILVGAGTARAEAYGPAEEAPEWAHLRAARPPTAPLAVVSRRLDLDPDSPLLTAAPESARTIVITCAQPPAEEDAHTHAEALAAVREHCEVIVAGTDTVDLAQALAELRRLCGPRIVCEGGPHLLSDLIRTGIADELCLTRSPVLIGPRPGGPDSRRLIDDAGLTRPVDLELIHHEADDDGYLCLLYRLRV